MNKKSIVINSSQGLDATPIARIVQEAGNFSSTIYIVIDGKKINAKSIMGMMTLTLIDGIEMEITAEGSDEVEAVDGLVAYIASLCA